MAHVSAFAEDNLGELYGAEYQHSQFQLHHVLGRTAKHNKVHIGHWFILPVPIELHDVSSNNSLNVTHHKRAFTDKFGSQSELFIKMCGMIEMCGMINFPEPQYFPPAGVIAAIHDTRA